MNGCYELAADLHLNGEFVSLGNQFETFRGVLDGKGHTIYGLHILNETQYAGLFACNEGTVKNLNLQDIVVKAVAYVGAVAGINNGKIENCQIADAQVDGTSFVGEIAGVNKGEITDCGFKGEIHGTAFTGNVTEDTELFCLYVDVNGDDKNEGSFEKPLRTLTEARSRVREMIHEGRTVKYSSYHDECVTITGGIPAGNWEACPNGYFRSYQGKEASIQTLCINGELKRPARTSDMEVIPELSGTTHVQAYFSHGWFSEILPVTAIKREEKDVETSVTRGLYSHNPSYLVGAAEFIKDKGDWALGEDGYLYYNPEENDPMDIIIPSCKRIFSICGKKENPVENVIIEGICFKVSDFGEFLTSQGGRGKEGYDEPENTHAAIYFENVKGCVIRGCNIENCGVNAVSIQGSSTNNRIESNRIKNVGYAGIHCQGSWIDTKDYINHHNLIFNNEISDVGMFAVHGAGVYLLGSGHNHLYRNKIYNTPRYGVSMKGARFGCWKEDCGYNLNDEISFEEHWDYLHSRNNLIEGNEIYAAGKNSLDGGGVESWGPGKGNVIDYNLIYDFYNGIPTLNWKGHGIFLDDASHFVTVTNNIVYESGKQGADASVMMKSLRIVVRNNIFDVTNTHQGAANILFYVEPCGEQEFYNNIVYADPKGGIDEEGRFVENGSPDRRMYTWDFTSEVIPPEKSVKYLDKNLYFNTSGQLLVSRNNNKPEMDVLVSELVEQTGYDKNSINADPHFVDAANRDYTLKDDSPAFALGIRRIDRNRMGVLNNE